MCRNAEIKIGIKKLDFISYRGKMMVYLTDGRQILVPLSFFPDIKGLSVKGGTKQSLPTPQVV